MSADLRSIIEAYKAVHNNDVKESLNSSRDEITEMDLSHVTDSDLVEIVESVLEEMFQKGYSVNSARVIFDEMFVESNIAGRQSKIERLCETIDKTFDVIGSKASTIALEEFGKYSNNKRLQESWSARFNQEKRVERTHSKLIAQESLNIKTLLLQLVEKADKSYLETDMKKRQANNEKARKDMEKMGTKMKNPAFEEVSNIRKGWGDAYASIYEKKLDPVGKEDSDIDNDGDVDSSDKYLAKRRKAIGKAMKEGVRDTDPEKGTAERKARLEKKRGMKMDDHPQYKKEEVEKEGYMPMTPERTARVEKAKKKAYNMDMRAQAKGDTKEADKQFKRRMAMDSRTKMKKEGVEFSETELKAFEEIVNSWED